MLQAMFDAADVDHSNTIDFEEFNKARISVHAAVMPLNLPLPYLDPTVPAPAGNPNSRALHRFGTFDARRPLCVAVRRTISSCGRKEPT